MADSAGQIGLDLVINQGQFNRQLNSIQGLAKKAGKALAGAFAVKSIVNFGKQCIELGSDLSEVQNVVDVTFSTMTDKIDKFAKSAASQFGLSETMAKQFTGTFGAMAKAFGFTEKEAYDMSTALTGLAGDVASFYNISQDEAFTKLKSVFSGETETLKDLGIVMTQSALDQYALANGFGKTTSAMSEQEKVALRYAFVQQQLALATGDFARTSDGWANQIRILSLQFDSLKASIGQGLINLFTPIIKAINLVLGKLVTLANAFKSFTAMLTGKKASNASVSLKNTASGADKAASSINKATSSANNLNKATKNTGKSAKKAADTAAKAAKKAAKKISGLMGFDQINKLTASTTAGTNGSTGSGSGGSGAGGGIGGGGISSGDLDMGGLSGVEDTTTKGLKGFKNLQKAIEKLKKSFGEFSKIVTSAFKWIWKNMLVPLGKWTMNKLAPKLIELLAAGLDVLTAVCKALQPLWQWAWEHLFKPMAKFVGNAIIGFLDLLIKGLTALANWISKHQTAVQNIAIVLASFFMAFKLVSFVTKFMGPISNAISGIKMFGKGIISFKTLFSGLFPKLFAAAGKAVAFFTSPVGIAVAIVGGLIAVGILLWKNWDKIKKTKFGKFLTKIAKGFKDLFKWVKKNLNPIKLFKKAWEGIKDKKAKLEAEAKEKVDGAISKLKDGWESIKDKTSSLLAEAKEKAEGAIDSLKNKWESIKDKVAELKAEAKEKSEGAISKLQDSWESIKDRAAELKAEAKEKASGALDSMKEKWESIKDKAATLEAKVKGALDTAENWWSDINKKAKDLIGTINATVDLAKGWASDWWSKNKPNLSSISATVSLVKNWASDWWSKNKPSIGSISAKVDLAKDWASNWWSKNKPNLSVKAAVSLAKGWASSWWSKNKPKIPNLTSTLKIKVPKISLKTATKTILGKKFTYPTGFSLKWLAQGGYVKKNTPQLAMIGDNRHQGEVVAPEDKMIAMAKKAAQLSGGGNRDAEIIRLLMELINIVKSKDTDVYLDGRKVTKTVNSINNADIKAGKKPILI